MGRGLGKPSRADQTLRAWILVVTGLASCKWLEVTVADCKWSQAQAKPRTGSVAREWEGDLEARGLLQEQSSFVGTNSYGFGVCAPWLACSIAPSTPASAL